MCNEILPIVLYTLLGVLILLLIIFIAHLISLLRKVNHPLLGTLDYDKWSNSYIVRISCYCHSGNVADYPDKPDIKSVGNGILAADWLLDQLECPLWVLLKYQRNSYGRSNKR